MDLGIHLKLNVRSGPADLVAPPTGANEITDEDGNEITDEDGNEITDS